MFMSMYGPQKAGCRFVKDRGPGRGCLEGDGNTGNLKSADH